MAPRSLLISVLALSAGNAAAFAPQSTSPHQLAVPADVASRNALFASYLESMGGTATAPAKSYAPSKWSPTGNSAPVVENPVTVVTEPESNSYANSWSPSGPSPLAPEGPVTAAATPPKTSFAPSSWSPSGVSAATVSEPVAAQPEPVAPATDAQAPKKSYAPSGWKPSGGFAAVPESTAAPVEYSAPAPVEPASVKATLATPAAAASAPKSNWSVSKWSPTGKTADASTSAFNSLLGAAEAAAAPAASASAAAAAPKSNWSVSKWSPSGGASGPTTMASLNDFSAPAAAAPAQESGSVATAVAEPVAEPSPVSLEDLAKERAEIMESASLSDVKDASAEPSDRIPGEKLKVVKARRKVGKSNTEASEGRRGVLLAGLGAMFAAAAGLKTSVKPESPGYEFLRKMTLAGVSEEGATSFADRFMNRQSQFKVPPIEKRVVPERRVLGKVKTTENGKPVGGRVLPKEELSSETLNYIKNYQKTL